MIKCLGSMVSVLPMCSDAPGTVSEGMKEESSLQTGNNRQVESAFSNTDIREP